jgi:hypothetical protein
MNTPSRLAGTPVKDGASIKLDDREFIMCFATSSSGFFSNVIQRKSIVSRDLLKSRSLSRTHHGHTIYAIFL